VGKSSFLLAGLIPYLEEECIGYRVLANKPPAVDQRPERERAVLFVRATNDLSGQLAQRLFDYCAEPIFFETPTQKRVPVDLPGILEHCLQSRPSSADALRTALQNDPTLLGRVLAALGDRLPYGPVLVIDQCEEVFTLARTPEEHENRRLALEMLRQVVHVPGRYKVVVSLRTEYYGRLIDRLRQGLRAAAGVREYLLTDLMEEQLVEAIRRPTSAEPIPYAETIPYEKYRFRYAEGVVEALARQALDYCAGKQDSVLPLVQVICAQLYEAVRGRPDQVIRREDLGGFEGGMRKHVEQLVTRLLAQRSDQKSFKKLFTRLYLRQPDGTLTTALLPEEDLARRWKGRTPSAEVFQSAARGDFRLLRVNTLRLGGREERRYVSLGHDALAPVAAQWDEELRRWARVRKWVALVAGMSVVTVVMAWLAVSARHHASASEENIRRARQAANTLSEVAVDLLDDVPATEEWQTDLLETTLKIYAELKLESSTDPALQHEIAVTYRRRGSIQAKLGKVDLAKKDYLKAIDLFRQLRERSPNEPNYQHGLAAGHNDLAELLREHAGQCPKEKTEGHYRQAIELEGELVGKFPEKADCRRELARAHDGLGLLLQGPFNKRECAKENYDRAIAVLSEMSSPEPSYRFELSCVYLNRALLLMKDKQYKLAQDDDYAAIHILEKLRKESNTAHDYRQYKIRTYRHYLGKLHHNLGFLFEEWAREDNKEKARYHDAVRELEKVVEVFEELAHDFPKTPIYREELANSCHMLGNCLCLVEVSRFKEAKLAYCKSLHLYEALIKEFPDRMQSESRLGNTLHDFALLFRDCDPVEVARLLLVPAVPGCQSGSVATPCNLGWRLHDRASLLTHALRLLRDAVRHQEAAINGEGENLSYRNWLAGHHWGLAETLIRLGDHARGAEEAEQVHQLCSKALRDSADYSRGAADLLARCVRLAETDPEVPEAQRKAAAGSYAREAVQILRELLQGGHIKCEDLDKDDWGPVRRHDRDGFQALLTQPSSKKDAPP
jgi:tetratricopeptide (TPR) repeat protein